MRCDQCKHWKRAENPDWEDDGAAARECSAVQTRWDLTDEVDHCRFDDTDKFIAARREILIAAKAYVVDGSQYTASLITMPNFGCVLFEKSIPSNEERPE